MHKPAIAICAAVLAPLASAQEHGPHEHGVAELSVALEGRQLSVELDGPLDSFAGFEHAPRSATERASLERAMDLLRKPETVLALPGAAGCALVASELHTPFAASKAGGAGAGHADLEASYQFDCATPSALQRLDVRLFDNFPRLRKLKAAVVAPGGQSGANLVKGKASLKLGP